MKRWNKHHQAKGVMSGDAVKTAPYPTWASFRAASQCSGSFIGTLSIWCMFSVKFNNDVEDAEQGAIHETLHCSGRVLETVFEVAGAEKFVTATFDASHLPSTPGSGWRAASERTCGMPSGTEHNEEPNAAVRLWRSIYHKRESKYIFPILCLCALVLPVVNHSWQFLPWN